ncbi:MAG: hypothetical protein JJU45_09620 [Acidimicrobiia bacterium]|nr:hypothetical protein [Acidimicrobiia bacterium]
MTARQGSSASGDAPPAEAEPAATDATTPPRLVHLQPLFTAVAVATGVGYAASIAIWPDAVFAFTFDDAFYYFGIARNLAEGAGSTFDGINPTNGYHPMWLLLSVPAFMAGLDGLDAARVLVMAQLGCYALAVATLGRAVCAVLERRPLPSRAGEGARMAPPVAAAIVGTFALLVANPFIVRMFANGLESGIAVLFYALLLTRLLSVEQPLLTHANSRWRAFTGLLLLLIVLTRTDAVLLLGCLGLWCLAELRSLPADRRRHGMGAMVELFAPAGVGLLSYLVLNEVRFGSALQVSGELKRADLTPARIIAVAVVVGLAALVGAKAWQRSHGEQRPRTNGLHRTSSALAQLGWFSAFCILLVGYYSILSVQQWLWYFAPLGVLLLLVVPLFTADLLDQSLRTARRTDSTTKLVAPAAAIVVVPLLVAGALQMSRFVDPDLRSIQVANRDAGAWIADNLDDDAILASWDAGVVGYFADRPVVNIDGVANSPAFVEAVRSGRVGPFLDAQGVGYIVNHGVDIDGEDPAIEPAVTRFWNPEVAERTQVVTTWPFTFSGTTTGAEGWSQSNGTRAVFLYQLPPADSRR